eukprot:gene10751-22461_t
MENNDSDKQLESKKWILLDDENFPSFGSSAHFSSDTCLIIGGWNIAIPQVYLSVFSFNILDIKWSPIMINTSGVRNRAYHAGVTIGKHIFLIGGEIASSPNNSSTDEVIRCIDTDEGYKLVVTKAECGARRGMSACPLGNNRAILFGGCAQGHQGESYPSDLWQFSCNENDPNPSWQRIDTDGEGPSGRAFHSAVSCGDQNRNLVIIGGHDGKKLMDEIWVLDMSLLLNLNEVEPVAKNKTSKSKTTLPRWTRLDVKGGPCPCPRFMHASFAMPRSTSNINMNSICVFGGVGESGLLNADVHELIFSTEGYSDDPKYVETRVMAKSRDEGQTVQGAAVVVVMVMDSSASVTVTLTDTVIPSQCPCPCPSPAMVLTFGGRTGNASSSVLSLLDDNIFTAQLLGKLQSKYPDPSPPSVPVVITHMDYANGDVYDGDLVEEYRVREGTGRMKYASDGSVYEGQWRRNKRHGAGTLFLPNGYIYTGDFDSDHRTGHGKLVDSEGVVLYEGEWSRDLYHGRGRELSANGDLYDGSFLLGQREGFGLLRVHSSGDSYEGQWVKGLQQGRGIQCSANGDRFEGYFENGKRHGEGCFRHANGAEYNGSWRSNKPNGFGTFVSTSLDEYKGKWVGGRRCGRGVWRTLHGDESYDGIWDEDVPNGQGEKLYSDGSKFEGWFLSGQRHGQGHCHNPDGSEYIGDWAYDRKHGFGTWTGVLGTRSGSLDEISYEGEWANDKRNGQGIARYASGAVFEGAFVDDHRMVAGSTV